MTDAEKREIYEKICEELGGYVHLMMPHNVFVDFSNQVRDGVPTLVVFEDAETGDMYCPEDNVTMTYISAEDGDIC